MAAVRILPPLIFGNQVSKLYILLAIKVSRKPQTVTTYPHYIQFNIFTGTLFITSKNLVVRRMMFPHQNIHKCTWISPEGKTQTSVFTG